jgi:hypothetical protein
VVPFLAVRESRYGPERQFVAVQRYGCSEWNTGRSPDAAYTAGPGPKPASNGPIIGDGPTCFQDSIGRSCEGGR